LWGREAVGAFKSVLRRQRYDWAWHTNALSSVFKNLANILEAGTPILGLVGEAEPGLIGATLIAAGTSGFQLKSMAIRPEEEQAQITWQIESNRARPKFGVFVTQAALEYAKKFLKLCSEPQSYLITISAAFMGITQSWNSLSTVRSSELRTSDETPNQPNEPVEPAEPTPSLIYTSTYNAAREALSYRSGFLRYSLLDASDIEAASRVPDSQSSLFSLDLVKSPDEDVDSEIPLADSESIPDRKTHPVIRYFISALLWLRELDVSDPISTVMSQRYLI
jgi:hypothetical protein